MGLPAKQRLRSIGTGLTGSPIPVRTPFSAAQLHADFRQVRQYLFHGVFGFFVGERAVRRAQNQTVRQTLFARSHMLAGVYVEQRQAFQRFSGSLTDARRDVCRGHGVVRHQRKVTGNGRVLGQLLAGVPPR